MKKPNNFDNTQVSGDFTPVNLGGHYAVIKQVNETTSKSGRDMIVVLFDFVAPDQQADYFMNSFKADIRPDKKWPYQGTQYILTEDRDGNCTKSFKSFITCVEKSNNGFLTQWGDNFCSQFKGKKIGTVFGNVEEEYNGEVKMRRRMRWFCKWDAVATANVPQDKLLNGSSSSGSAPATNNQSGGFSNIPADDTDLPF